MAFINQAVTVLQTLVIALGAGLAVWDVVNLMEGYGNDNPGAKSCLLYTSLRTSVKARSLISSSPPSEAGKSRRQSSYSPSLSSRPSTRMG